jgi:pimeloyl-ACP methyl ester carboxylesterase
MCPSTDMTSTDIASLPPTATPRFPGHRSPHGQQQQRPLVHVLEAGFQVIGRACVLLHGFPELAYSWRKGDAAAGVGGYHVIAPDQRGYGRTTGWDASYDADRSFRILNMVRRCHGPRLCAGLSIGGGRGRARSRADSVASWCSLIRPDVFRSVALMSSPFAGAPSPAFNTANGAAPPRAARTDDELDAELAKLPRPRKYYHNHQRTRGANDDMLHAPQGLHAFFRAYYHYKSADWTGNKPHPLTARTAEEMAKIPTYYVMDRDKGMAETVAPFMPSAAEIATCKWLTDAEVDVYAAEYARTSFTGALQGYRVRRGTDPKSLAELRTFAGRTIDVPACFIAGKSDWGSYQTPGVFEAMQTTACSQWRGTHLVAGAGHWVQQEQPEDVSGLLIQFLRG